MKNFWEELKTPISCLAPMHDVSDAAFRQVVAACGKPDVFFTEFVSIYGLVHEKSREKMEKYYLQFGEGERPIVAQIWGTDPDIFFEAGKIIEGLGYDGVDINMGCPDKKVVASGAGAAHMQDTDLALRCIEKLSSAVRIPVSVKTRIGFDETDLRWTGDLLQTGIAALTIHLRTKKELSKVPAHWELTEAILSQRKNDAVRIIGNGDIQTAQEGKEKCRVHGLDGYMIGRGILGNPWAFSEKGKPDVLEDRLRMLLFHIGVFEKYFSGVKSFSMLKKHVRGYIGSFRGAKRMRSHIMESKTSEDMMSRIRGILKE